MTPRAYDFRNPGRLPDDVASLLLAWQRQGRGALECGWACHLPFAVRAATPRPSLSFGRELQARHDHELISYRIDLGQPPAATSVLLPRQVAVTLVGAMLGDAAEELAADRALTNVERTLMELLMSEVHQALKNNQPWTEPLALVARGEQPWREMRQDFPDSEFVALVSFEMELPFGNHTLDWVLSRTATSAVAAAARRQGPPNERSAAKLRDAVRLLPVDVTVRLGNAKLYVSELRDLREGDVVLLDQRLAEPMAAEVGNTRKLLGWPGRVGNKQAFQIETLVE